MKKQKSKMKRKKLKRKQIEKKTRYVKSVMQNYLKVQSFVQIVELKHRLIQD